jgi:gamma-glutamyltranspeptidase/glutathione hydrolase
MLKLLERFPMGNVAQNYGFGQVRALNVMIEALRLCFADRAIWMGDDDVVHVPVNGFLSSDYVNQRSALINPDARRSNATLVAGDPRPFDFAFLQKRAKSVKLARASTENREGIHTTHFSIVDRWGNAVSYTNTIESDWGTGLMVPGYGFMLNNELTDFNLTPTFNSNPNNFNPGANDVAPNKRPRSSMTPIMIFKGDTLLAATGSPGGATIISTVFQMALNLIDQKMVVQDAINAARISVVSPTGAVSRESSAVYVPGIPASTISILQVAPYGHSFSTVSDIGSAQTVIVDQRSRFQYGAADFRRIGAVETLP